TRSTSLFSRAASAAAGGRKTSCSLPSSRLSRDCACGDRPSEGVRRPPRASGGEGRGGGGGGAGAAAGEGGGRAAARGGAGGVGGGGGRGGKSREPGGSR